MNSLSARDARRIALCAGSSPFTPVRPGIDGALDAIRGAGFLQIDTIGVVERAHLHVLKTRVPDCPADPLPALEGVAEAGRPRSVIEYWAHAAAWIPLEDWRFCIPRMERIRADGHEWFRVEEAAVAFALDRVRAEGPLMARDFTEQRAGRKGWWDWKPAKVALEFLFHAGALVSVTRRGFQKVYDLAERALPPGLDLRKPSPIEHARRHLERSAVAYGVFAKEDATYLRRDGIEAIETALAEAVEDGALIPVRVEGLGNRKFFATSDALSTTSPLDPHGGDAIGRAAPRHGWQARILSPFDPCVLDRKRLKRLFGEDYALECYLPASKRAFGYFALPVMVRGPDGDGFVCGKADCKLERVENLLRLRRLEIRRPAYASVADPKAIAESVAFAFAGLASRLGAHRVEIECFDRNDEALRAETLRAFASAGFAEALS
ncbi:MAG: YcaQ family DNA glycosylase [Spirochaetales bacterium]|nr:YcaQ family DNA glycosylase [Spirochaetales bacterium]